MFLYIIQLSGLILLSTCLIIYYSHKSVAYYARLLIFISFLVNFISFMILPIDIYQNSLNLTQENVQENQANLQMIGQLWTIIFYINFFNSWIILPFFQEYEDSGQFTIKGKIKDALKLNAILIGILTLGAALIVVYLIIFQQFQAKQIPSVFAMLVNVFGMLLVTLALGFGLVSLPKQFFVRRNYKRRVNICHRSAQNLKNQEQQILQKIYHIRQLLVSQSSLFDDQVQVSALVFLISVQFNLQNFRSFDQPHKSLRKKSLADLHKLIKRLALQLKSCESQLDQLVDELKNITVSFSNNNYKYKKIWYNFLFILATLISLILYSSQISIFTTQKISVIYWLNYDLSLAYFSNCLLMVYIVYILTHTILRIKIYRIFQLHKSHSTAASLLFTSINMSRINYPLCYNYLQLTSLTQTQFQRFLGDITIPQQIKMVFPVAMIILGFANLFDVYDVVIGYLGLSTYAFDDEEQTQICEHGRKVLVERLKQRNYQNMQMEMIQLL